MYEWVFQGVLRGMFRAEPMTRVLLVLPRSRLRAAVEALYDLQVLHIRDHVEGRDGLRIGTPVEGASEASETLIRIRSMIATLDLEEHEVKRPIPVSTMLEELKERFELIEGEVRTLGENRTRLETEVRNIDQKIEAMDPFIALGLDLELYRPYDSLVVLVGTASGDPAKALTAAGLPHEIFTPKRGGLAGLVAVFVAKDHEEEAKAVLSGLNFSPIPLPECIGDPRAVCHVLTEGKARTDSALEEVNHDLEHLRDTYDDLLVAAEEHLTIEVDKTESPLRFGSTANALTVEGWVPTGRLGDLEAALKAAVDDAYHIEVLEDEPEGHAHSGAAEVANDGGEPVDDAEGKAPPEEAPARTPVQLRNPSFMAPYEFLVRLISTPKYDEIDPTPLLFITFPIFFGLMLGDIAYGLMLVVGGYVLFVRTKSEVMKTIVKFIAMGGAYSVVFGFLYGEAFGFELFGAPHGLLWGHDLYVPAMDLYLPINRLEDAMLMIKLCIYIGVFHVLLGNAVGFVNARSKHGTLHAFLAKGSWFFIIIGGTIVFRLYFGGTLNLGDPLPIAGLVMLLYGVVGLLAGEGMGGLLEMPGVLSNILSYTRIFAIGLSSVGIAMTFNNLSGMLWESGALGAVAAAVICAMGHILNILLGILGSTLHSLRLHYVEWMSKFYTGGGEPYSPWGRTRRYTEV